MTILRVGTNAKYANGWDDVFGKGKSKASSAKKAAKKSPAKKAKKKK
jgi:hypothetical protein